MTARRVPFLPSVLAAVLMLPSLTLAAEPGLALVPADAAGFAHIRFADIWRSDSMKEMRDLLQKAGPKALQAFDQRFLPAPSSLHAGTAILVRTPQPGEEPPIAFVLTTSAPFNAKEFVQRTLPESQPQKVGDITLHVDLRTRTALYVPNDRTIVFGPPEGVQKLLQAPKRTSGPMQPALALAASKPIVLALNAASLPPEVRGAVPPPFAPLLDCQLVTVTVDIGKEMQLGFEMRFANAQKAMAGEQAVGNLVAMARQTMAQARTQFEKMLYRPGNEKSNVTELPEAAAGLFGLAMLAQYDELLKNLPLQRKDATLAASLKLSDGTGSPALAASAIGVGLLLPAVQKVREAANRMSDSNNLKQIALAMHNYHNTYSRFPAAAIYDKDGKPLLSWRVAILPYIEGDSLYKQFKLDEPWDSENNKKLLPLMPKTYALPIVSRPGDATTYYRVITGPNTIFDDRKGRGMRDITDGTSNTLLVVESADAVPWTKPDDLVYDPKGPLPRFGTFYEGGFNAALADGSVRLIKMPAEQSLRALITRNGNEIIRLEP